MVWMVWIHLVVRRQVLPQLQLIFVVLEVVAALLRRPTGQLIGDHLPVAPVLLKESDKFVFLVTLPLVLRFYAAAEQRWLIYRASNS